LTLKKSVTEDVTFKEFDKLDGAKAKKGEIYMNKIKMKLS